MRRNKLLLLAALAAIGVFAVIGVTVAKADVSPGPVTASSTTLYWTGQGTPVNQQCGDSADPGAGGYQNGASAGDYMLWIFSTDGGSVAGAPTLTINGTTYSQVYKPSGTDPVYNFPGAWQIVTPYIDPSTITPADPKVDTSTGTAYTNFTVSTTGGGSWVLTISHGCNGGTTSPADLQVSKDATPSFTRTYTWQIDKSTSAPTVYTAGGAPGSADYTVDVRHDSTDSGWQVSGKITVFNPNTFDVSGVNVTDTIDNGGTCDVTNGTGATIPAGSPVQFGYSCAFTSNPGSGTNTASATWPDIGSPKTSADGTATYDFGSVDPTIVDGSVDVTDSVAGDLGMVSYQDPSPRTFNYSGPVSGDAGKCTDNVNTVTFTTNTTGATHTAGATVSDCQGADLTVTKTATPSFTRTYNWEISKSVDKTLFKQVGGTVTANYTVIADETGFTDSGWQVSGTITVHNPNAWEPVTLTGVTDAINNGGACTVSGNTTQTIAANGDSTALTYTCTYAAAPSLAAFTNTATATWSATDAHTPDGTKDGTASGAFNDGSTGNPTRVNQTITVVDDKTNPSNPVTLGTLTATDTTPYTTHTYQYPMTFNVGTGCTTYTNTASITETKQSASQTVNVCGPANTGALTIGFWKTTNGQNLIKTYCGTDPTGLGAYLRGLGGGSGPFSNAPSSCSSLATYALNILNAASASNMNSMLKAQMLGTALDVWFSGPGYTGTTVSGIKPPSKFLSNNKLGTFNMDTTAVCPMVDNTTAGTATCLNNQPSTNAMASGAVPSSSMTMQAIVNFAATTPSPFNGSTSNSIWYGGSKTLEEILKNIFDQFNNGMAFGSF
jgi:hypothetical protein